MTDAERLVQAMAETDTALRAFVAYDEANPIADHHTLHLRETAFSAIEREKTIRQGRAD